MAWINCSHRVKMRCKKCGEIYLTKTAFNKHFFDKHLKDFFEYVEGGE